LNERKEAFSSLFEKTQEKQQKSSNQKPQTKGERAEKPLQNS
jgi:hypothetical protein